MKCDEFTSQIAAFASQNNNAKDTHARKMTLKFIFVTPRQLVNLNCFHRGVKFWETEGYCYVEVACNIQGKGGQNLGNSSVF